MDKDKDNSAPARTTHSSDNRDPGSGGGPISPAEGLTSHTIHDKPSKVAAHPLEPSGPANKPQKPARHPGRVKTWIKQHRALTALLIVVLVASLITGGVVWARRKPHELPRAGSEASPTPTPVPTPTTKPSALTGVLVEPTVADQPIMASIVENLVGTGNARPQSGLSSAGVVYEALSEGGITRYLALWQADIPADIGPVRSLRPVFYDSAMEYGAPVAHAGGSTDGLALAHSGAGFKDLDQFFNGDYYRRITTRYAPHNLYISGSKLTALVAAKGWNKPPSFTPWTRKDDAPSATPTASSITLDFSGPDYQASFTYQAATNSYLRFIAGKPDVDAAAASKQINPKTIIVAYTNVAYGTQANGKPKSDIDISGTGKGIVFQDGIATPMTWQKSGSTARMKFTDTDGKEIALNRGQSWVSYVPTTFPAVYK